MKKNYFKAGAFCALLSAFFLPMSGQLSGVYTINSGQLTGGTNYQTFNAFATAINAQGTSGPVTVNVVTGTGPYVEQVEFNQITGATAANRITINGNNNILRFGATVSANPHTLRLNGTDFMSINNLNVEGTGATYALVCILTNSADYNKFDNCTFTAPQNGTGSSQAPFCISGTGISPTGTGASGNFNTITSSTLSNGYYSFTSYGGSSLFPEGNSIIDSRITDWYMYGPYFYYNKFFTMRGCTIDRMTRTTSTTTYPYYAAYNTGAMVEGNLIYKLFESNQGVNVSMYTYMYYQAITGGARNTFRNNIITDIKFNGSLYPYAYYGGWDMYNNTFDYDWAGGNHTGTMYAIYAYSNSTYGDFNIYSNIITMRRPGTGTRYGIYTGGITTNVNIDNNNIVVQATNGNNYIGYYTTTALTHAAWKAQGVDPNGYNLDPMYVSATDLHPTNPLLNNLGTPRGLMFDYMKAVRNVTTPDIGALEFLTPLCAGTPTQTIAGPNFSVCPGESATFSIGGLSSDVGYTYQWLMSYTSNVGPWTNLNSNSILYTVPNVTATTWVSAIVSCTAPGGASIQPVGVVHVSGPTASVVPYYENFEGIGLPDRLPNCSWYSPNIGGKAKTFTSAGPNNLLPRSGNAFASFNNNIAGDGYYYTNQIWMDLGVTYSASVWYQTDFTGGTNFTDFSILLGTTQTTTGLKTIATTGGPAVSPVYKSLSNTFTVPASGYYYVAVRAKVAVGLATNLSWDDLLIEIPCTPTMNTPTLTLAANNTTICSGETLVINASGADDYVWNNGNTGSALADQPMNNTTYMVVATNTLTGCKTTGSQAIVVKQTPLLNVFAIPPSICTGNQANLQASGASSYVWSTSGAGSSIYVKPTSTTIYQVSGTGTNNCTAYATVQVSVMPLPSVLASASNPQACVGEAVSLSATGGNTYQWVAPSVVLQGSNPTMIVSQPTNFTVTGTNANGCSNTAYVTLTAEICAGISERAANDGIKVYPNPATTEITIAVSNTEENMIVVTDVTGRIVAEQLSANQETSISLRHLASGVYYVRVQSNHSTNVIKIIKQ